MHLFNFFKKQPTLAIAAIFRNEKEYILEWLAWHISQGIAHFIIYDNESDDGTTELLQKLGSAGIIKFHSIPRQDKVQIKAYKQIFDDYKKSFDLIAVIDADEFLMPMNNATASTVIQQLFQDPDVGALAVNWRIFGSNNHLSKPHGPVLSNYTMAANEQRSRNHFIKSIYRTKAITRFMIHVGVVKNGYRYINTQGDDVIFSTHDTLPSPTENNTISGVSQRVSTSKLRINHYAVKSVEEFTNKKKNKGRSSQSKNTVLGDHYFQSFDLNDEEISINHLHIQKFRKQYLALQKLFE